MAGLYDYAVERDCFDYDVKRHVYCFPCTVCVHQSKRSIDPPCNRCDHNANAIGKFCFFVQHEVLLLEVGTKINTLQRQGRIGIIARAGCMGLERQEKISQHTGCHSLQLQETRPPMAIPKLEQCKRCGKDQYPNQLIYSSIHGGKVCMKCLDGKWGQWLDKKEKEKYGSRND